MGGLDGTGARFRLLGPVSVVTGNRLVEIGAARQRCVLAVLLLDANRAVSVDQLVERVWGGHRLPERPRKAAQIYVSLLRTALAGIDGVAIVRRPDGYLIELDERCVDVRAFHHLVGQARAQDTDDRAMVLFERALGMWRGPAFGELDTPWLADVRESLHQQRLAAERDLTDLRLRDGRHGMVLPQLSSWALEHPLDERLAGQLMLALFRSGRQADALEAYRRIRERLADELGTGPGRPLNELYQRILTDDPALRSTPDGPVPVRSAVPRQLPAAPQWFTGRRAELDALLHQHAGDVVAISAIDGMAGVGKTALAVHTAHRLAARYPDGQLFVDLHGYTEGVRPRTPGEALDRLLRALGVPPERVPADVEDRAALYRQRLTDTRTLIVLDNAVDEAQIRPLLPGDAGCLVLVTSRRRLKGLDDAHAVSLDVLPTPDALALLKTATGPDRTVDGWAELAELCGRQPLALRIAGALLRHRPSWTVAHLAGLLRDQRRRISVLSDGERDLGAVFHLSYRHLGGAHQELFRRLGLIPGPDTDAYASAALAESDPDTATRLLEDLVDHNLLVAQAPGRYRMHDLVRLHARALSRDDPDRDAAVERLLDHYQHTAGRADDLVTRFPRSPRTGPVAAHTPPLPDPEAAWAWLRAERPNLLAALHHAIVRDHAERIVALTAGVATLLHVDGPWTEAVSLHIMATAAARHVGDRHAWAHALTRLGDLRGATGDFPGAIRDLRDAVRLARELGDGRAQANALTRLGQIHGFVGDHETAIRDLREALDVFRGLGERRGQVNALTMLGQTRGMAGDLANATRDLRAALDLSRRLGDRRGQANALARLGQIQQRTGDYPGALRDLRAALGLFRGLGDRTGQAHALACVGDVRGLTGDHRGAIRDLSEALELFRRQGERLGQANAITMLGQVRSLAGDHPGAIRDLRAGLAMFQRTGAHGNEVWALNNYATVLAATGDRPRALTIHSEALVLARRTRQPEAEANALEGIGECHLRTGDTESGTTHLEQALAIFQRLTMAPDVDRVRSRLTRLASG